MPSNKLQRFQSQYNPSKTTILKGYQHQGFIGFFFFLPMLLFYQNQATKRVKKPKFRHKQQPQSLHVVLLLFSVAKLA